MVLVMEAEEAENALDHSLKELGKKGAPYFSIGKIIDLKTRFEWNKDSITIKHTFIAELVDNEKVTKTYDIELLGESEFEDGVRIKLQCPGEEAVVMKFNWSEFLDETSAA